MHWASPTWSLSLLAWAGAVLYLLVRVRRPVDIPNVWLWRTTAVASQQGGARRVPLAGVVLALVGAMGAILAAAQPFLGGGGAGVARVVLDRGVTSGGGRPFRGMVDRAKALVGGAPVQLVRVPAMGGSGAAWGDVAARTPPVAGDTGAAINTTVASLLGEPGEAAIVVLTDRVLAVSDPRVALIRPSEALGGVGIVAMAARERPVPQVMLRLVNRSASTTAAVRVSTGAATFERAVKLPATGGSVDVFVDVRSFGTAVTAAVDDGVADGRASLVQQGSSIEIEAAAGVPTAVGRMAEVFNSGVQDGPRSRAVVSDRPLPVNQAGVWVANGGAAIEAESITARVTSHPVTDGVVDWIGEGGTPPPGFVPLVLRGARALAAVREGPPRQVWVDVDVAKTSASVDWVVLLANAFRWVGGDDRHYTSEPPRRLDDGWQRVDGGPAPAGVEPGLWPGVYRSGDGQTIAINAAHGPTATFKATEATTAPLGVVTPEGRPFGDVFAIGAIACLGVGAAVWPGRRGRGKLT